MVVEAFLVQCLLDLSDQPHFIKTAHTHTKKNHNNNLWWFRIRFEETNFYFFIFLIFFWIFEFNILENIKTSKQLLMSCWWDTARKLLEELKNFNLNHINIFIFSLLLLSPQHTYLPLDSSSLFIKCPTRWPSGAGKGGPLVRVLPNINTIRRAHITADHPLLLWEQWWCVLQR